MEVGKFLTPVCEEVTVVGANLYHWDLKVPLYILQVNRVAWRIWLIPT